MYSLSDKVSQWFSLGTLVSSTNKTNCHNIVEYGFKHLWPSKTISLCPGHIVAGTYSVTHVRNSEIKQLSPCFEILTWYLVCGCLMISYRSSLCFVLFQWFLAELWPLDFEIWPNILLSPLFFAMLGYIDLMSGIWVYNDELQIKFTFRSVPLNATVLLNIWFDFWNVSVLLSRGWDYGLFRVEWSLVEKHLQLGKLKVTNFLISFRASLIFMAVTFVSFWHF
jgi:hypothetical protein